MINQILKNKTENFSMVPDQECALLIQNNFSEALESDSYFEWELVSKFLTIGFEIRSGLCDYLADALRRNSQKIGNRTISQWLIIYLARYSNTARSFNTFFNFVIENSESKRLTQADQIKLMRILRIYDYLLVLPFFDLEDLPVAAILKYAIYPDTSIEEIKEQLSGFSDSITQTSASTTASEKLTVKEALHKFPKLGEQSVTASAIKLKQFDQPVRPSVRNWLYDYTSHLGQTGHSSMDRTTYLFRSDNAKNLSSPEREKLAIILKSFDENTPLPIDGARQEIVFESFAKKEAAPQRTYTAPPSRPPASLNFIHHVEKPYADSKVRLFPSAPATSGTGIPQSRTLSETKFPPVQKQEISFVRPYSQPEITKTREADRSSTFPSSTKVRPAIQDSTFPSSQFDRDNSSKSNFQPPAEMEFTNPYPKPETHEASFEKKDENISNVRFSEGAPKNSFTPISQVSARKVPASGPSSPPAIPVRPPAPVQKPASPALKPAAYRFSPPEKNMIRPHYGRITGENRPEPKIDGNIVDLKGDK